MAAHHQFEHCVSSSLHYLPAIPTGLLASARVIFLAVCSIKVWVCGTASHLQRSVMRVPKTEWEDTYPLPRLVGRDRGREWGWDEEEKREVPTGGMDGTIILKSPEKHYCPSVCHPPTAIAVPLFPAATHPSISLYFPFPVLPLSVHPTAPAEPQLLPLRGLHHFTCCIICPGRAGVCM